jgi:ribosomal protein S18 acetylase RimI-like enzyme
MPDVRYPEGNMNINLRDSQDSDIPFLREMLYEAVFWRDSVNRPSFEEGLAYPDVGKSLADWGERDGDTAVVATLNSTPIGASWYRFWTDDNYINGYIDHVTPVLVIAVHRDYRHQGIGGKMIDWLIDSASGHSIQDMSLSVSKDNYAMNLYVQQGFQEYADRGDAFIMVRRIQTGEFRA